MYCRLITLCYAFYLALRYGNSDNSYIVITKAYDSYIVNRIYFTILFTILSAIIIVIIRI